MNPITLGLRWTGTAQASIAALMFAQVVVLARLLSPADFGLMAGSVFMVGLARVYADFGLSSSIVHHQELDGDELSSLYWINIAIASAIAGLLMAFAPFLSAFQDDARLQSIIRLLAIGLFISSFGSQYRALHQKRLDFKALAISEVTGTACGLVVAVASALAGLGVYALVAGYLVSTLISTALLITTGWQLHTPKLRFNFNMTRRHLRFGAFQAGEQTINYLSSQVDILLIGKLAGSASLGMYSVAKDACARPANLINPIFNRIAFPVMSTSQNDRNRLSNLYLNGMRVLCSINFPIYFLIMVAARPLVAILLGSKWLPAVPVLQILALYFAIRSTGNPVGSLLLATGRVRAGFLWNALCLGLVCMALLVGSRAGLTGMAWSLTALQLALILPNWKWLVQPSTGLGFVDYLDALIRPLGCAVFAAFAGSFSGSLVHNDIMQLAITIITGAITYLALSLIFNKRAVLLIRTLI